MKTRNFYYLFTLYVFYLVWNLETQISLSTFYLQTTQTEHFEKPLDTSSFWRTVLKLLPSKFLVYSVITWKLQALESSPSNIWTYRTQPLETRTYNLVQIGLRLVQTRLRLSGYLRFNKSALVLRISLEPAPC